MLFMFAEVAHQGSSIVLDNFFSSEFFASLSGAGVGAYFAYLLSARADAHKRRIEEEKRAHEEQAEALKNLKAEIAAINGAMALTNIIVNNVLGLKREVISVVVGAYKAAASSL